jgi:ribonuclease BN (tRNA processing enzyme)
VSAPQPGAATDGLTLTVLGASGSYPGPGAACSGYLVQGGGVAIALDLGPGTLANLQEHIAIADLDAIVLSHSHPDHWLDLGVLATALKWGLGREGLPVYGTAETRTKADALLDGLAPTFAWTDVDAASTIVVGPIELRFSATVHYVPTLACRVALDGAALAYSADTGPGWSFAAFGEPIDLAICEATHDAGRECEGTMHLSGRQAGALARDAGVGRLVVTHVSPGTDPEVVRAEAEAAFGAPVALAVEHAHFEV